MPEQTLRGLRIWYKTSLKKSPASSRYSSKLHIPKKNQHNEILTGIVMNVK